MAWSKDAMLGVAFGDSLRESLKKISEGARESPVASEPACSPQGQHWALPAGMAGNTTRSLHCLQGMGPSLGPPVAAMPWQGKQP